MSEFRYKIIKAMPIEKPFLLSDISSVICPHLVRNGKEGNTFNRGNSVIARLLRKIKGVKEISPGIFFAHKEFFYE